MTMTAVVVMAVVMTTVVMTATCDDDNGGGDDDGDLEQVGYFVDKLVLLNFLPRDSLPPDFQLGFQLCVFGLQE
jgi:hypothetical protein